MRRLLPQLLLPLFASGALAAYAVLYYNHWYYAGVWWPKWLLLTLLLTPLYALLLVSPWRGLWRALGWYWLLLLGGFALAGRSFDLSRLDFTMVLDLEVPMVWVPVVWVTVYAMLRSRAGQRAISVQHRQAARTLELRRRLRRSGRLSAALASALPDGAAQPVEVIEFPQDGGTAEDDMPETAELLLYPARTGSPEPPAPDSPDTAEAAQPANADAGPEQGGRLPGLLLGLLLGLAALLPAHASADGVDSTEPWTRPDRHHELKDESLRWAPQDPGLGAAYPAPLNARAHKTFYIVIDNRTGGALRIHDYDGQWLTLGKVLAPVRKLNPSGFTASGWGEPGTLIATAVNALHLKTKHDYKTGRSTVFSLLPIEFADFDPAQYQSYYSATASLVTDIPAGSGIFGGQWSPLIGSRVYVGPPGWEWSGSYAGQDGRVMPEGTVPMADDYSPAEGDVLVIAVARHKYNPEWIEFENRFGGIIWVKELGLDAYPVGQVLKPVAGAGRFQGSLYAPPGRIRANHPGVICISTSPDGQMGGFQIIPRDHSMSPEMTAARTKTQWMVVGPLWAFDPSWEGIPPLFTDYLYPAWVPTDGRLKDGTLVSGADVFLDRFTVRARYADSKTPEQYELLRPTAPLTFEALKDLTHLRIYFPRE